MMNKTEVNDNKKRSKLIKKMNKPHKEEEAKKPNAPGNVIDLNGVWKFYWNGSSEFQALSNINLHIKEGSFNVIVGKSGSGKSSLLNIMSGLIRATDGEVIVNGENLITYTNKELTDFRSRHCGFIFQQYGLLSTLTVKENVMVGDNLRCMVYDREQDMNFIEKIMDIIGISQLAHKYPKQLSGGQQQRVSIARAIAKRPNIIFGDEPTGAVDSSMTYTIMKLLKDVNKHYNTTIVLITHDERLIPLADHVIRIANGKIHEDYEQKPVKDFQNLFI